MFHNIIGVFWSFAFLHNTVYCNNRTRLGVDYRYRNSFFGVCVVRALFFGLLLGMEICYCSAATKNDHWSIPALWHGVTLVWNGWLESSLVWRWYTKRLSICSKSSVTKLHLRSLKKLAEADFCQVTMMINHQGGVIIMACSAVTCLIAYWCELLLVFTGLEPTMTLCTNNRDMWVSYLTTYTYPTHTIYCTKIYYSPIV